MSPPAPTSVRYTQQELGAFDAGAEEARQTLRPGALPGDGWWQAFGSSDLDRLVDTVLADNPTRQTAQASLAQARAMLAAARGAWYPQLSIGAQASRGGVSAERSEATVSDQLAIGPAASFVPDTFGATARRVEQSAALVEYQRAQRDATCLSLVGNTVLQAVSLASATEQMGAVGDIVAADQRNLELVRISALAGKTANLDVLTAESQLAADRALLPPLQQQAAAARHALALLAGRSSEGWSPPGFDFATLALPADLPMTLPSELVRHRPDIESAEAQLHVASAGIGIATAQLYPSLTLNASWTAQSVSSGTLFSNSANVWNIAASLLAPVFEGGTLRAQRAAATDAYAAQLGVYHQTVLQAFAEVADGLQALQSDSDLLESQRKALEAAQATLDLTQQSYQAGQTSLLQMLEAQRLYHQSRLGHVRAKAQRYADTTQWFVALGASPSACRLRDDRR